ncbi:uncharacterized protein PV09_09757 [Verruconis gallopava]|uniref:Uncharacterized protein n=1 Tax=Verruconis gallopava TaxID=253628 RepID=A0A0D1X8S3_9PEZI|nr:uncharacterized protein PV09_09757 [Verruconis gallopava]KIV98425.1 hypothetical protein PV09_09757 [Verruconis gallopava]
MNDASFPFSEHLTGEPPPPPPPSPMLVPVCIDLGGWTQVVSPCQAYRFMQQLYNDEGSLKKWKYRWTDNNTTLMVWSKSGHWDRDCRSMLHGCLNVGVALQKLRRLQVIDLARL